MMASTRIALRGGLADSGFVVMEVLVTVVLLAVLIVPLATGVSAAVGGAVRVREQAALLPAVNSESASRTAWEWGPMVGGLQWTSGPTATIELETRADSEVAVGLWVDGWFLGEWSPDGEHVLELPASMWSGHESGELTIRARGLDGPWGPPWRWMIPGEDFEPVPMADLGHDVVESDGATTGGETVVHVPGLAKPDVEILQPDTALYVDRLGLVFHLLPTSTAVLDIRLGEVAQCWFMENGRALDLYF
jgi:hypothetical protein